MRRVPQGAFARLERHVWNHTCAVLRSRGGDNTISLLDLSLCRPYAVGNLVRADDSPYDVSQRDIGLGSQGCDGIRSHMVRHLSDPFGDRLGVRLPLSKSYIEGGLSRADGLSYAGSRTDIGLCLTGRKVYSVSGIEIFASRSIRSKLSQALAGQEVVSPVCAQCSPDSVSRSETFARSFRRPT